MADVYAFSTVRRAGAALLLMCMATSMPAATFVGYEEAVSRALEGNPEIAALQKTQDESQADVRAVSGLPDPELQLFTENLGADELELTLTVPFEIGGKRRTRRDQAQLRVRIAELELEAKRIAIRAEVMRRYALASSLTALCERLDSQIEQQESGWLTVPCGATAGVVTDIEGIRAGLVLAELRYQQRATAMQRDLALSSLASLWGNAFHEPWQLCACFNDTKPSVTVEEAITTAANHPGWNLAATEQMQREADLARTRAESFPELSVTGGYKRDNDADKNIGLFGFSIGLPVFGRGSSAVAAKRHAVEKGRLSAQARRLLRENRIRHLVVTLHLIADRIRFLEDTAIVSLEKVHTGLRNSYRHNQVGNFEALEQRKEMLRLQTESLELHLRLAETAADLLELSGYEVKVFAE